MNRLLTSMSRLPEAAVGSVAQGPAVQCPEAWRSVMHLISFMVAALLVWSVTPAVAQEWIEFVSRDDGFRVNFPVQPTVTQTTFMSEFGAALPARAYSVVRDRERYSVTVADYRGIEKLLTDKAR